MKHYVSMQQFQSKVDNLIWVARKGAHTNMFSYVCLLNEHLLRFRVSEPQTGHENKPCLFLEY